METRLTHIRVNVSDINNALKWYEEILDFEMDSCWPKEDPKYYDFISEQGAVFSIMEVDENKSHGRVNFTVQNVDKFWETVKDKAEIVEPLFDTPWGSRKFTIKDLDGNELGFVG